MADASGLLIDFTKLASQWAFWAGLLSVMLFSFSRFNITMPGSDELSPPLSPRSFTTAFRFQLARVVYTGCYASLYLALLVAGSIPQVSVHLAEIFKTPLATTPAGAALVATAVVPALPWISSIDEWLRSQLQAFASIPTKARLVAREVLSALDPSEPAPIDNSSSLRKTVEAMRVHRERFDQLLQVWPKFRETATTKARRRFAAFVKENQKMVEGFKYEFSLQPNGLRNNDALLARFIENRYRNSVKKMARIVVCSMFHAESTEFAVRENCRAMGLKINKGGLDFQLKNIILSIFGISLAVLMSAYVAAIAYYVVNWPPVSLHDMLTQNTKLFLTWSILTVLIYLPPITLAAAASMYLFDQEQASVTPLTFTDYASGAVLTFIASVMLCFFVLLGYGVLLPSLTGTSVSEISKLAPWTIPAASVATTFLLLSVYPRHDTAKVSEPILYVGSLSGVALLGGLIAEFLSGPPEPGKLGTLPDDSIYYLVVIMPFCIGACIGWLLSGTRHPRQSGTDVRPAAPSLHQCESLSTTVSRAA